MGRDGLDRARLIVVLIEHEHGAYVHGAEGDLACVNVGHQSLADIRGTPAEIRVGRVEGDVGDQAEEPAASLRSVDHDIPADREPLHGEARIELDLEAGGKGSADNHAQRGLLGAASEVSVELRSIVHVSSIPGQHAAQRATASLSVINSSRFPASAAAVSCRLGESLTLAAHGECHS